MSLVKVDLSRIGETGDVSRWGSRPITAPVNGSDRSLTGRRQICCFHSKTPFVLLQSVVDISTSRLLTRLLKTDRRALERKILAANPRVAWINLCFRVWYTLAQRHNYFFNDLECSSERQTGTSYHIAVVKWSARQQDALSINLVSSVWTASTERLSRYNKWRRNSVLILWHTSSY